MATPEEQMLEQELLNYLYSSNEYGAGPGQLQSSKDLYKGLGYQEDAISDYFKVAGIYPEDLLGLPPAPEDPGAAPVRPEAYQSDLRTAYYNNPLAQQIIRDIEGGIDPLQASAGARALYNQDPKKYESYVPTSSDPYNQDPVGDWAQQFAQDYGTDYARQAREQGAADSEYQRALNEYAQKQDAYFRYNNPVSGLYEMGNPSLEGFRNQLGIQQVADRYAAPERVDYSRAPEAVSQIGSPMSTGPRRQVKNSFFAPVVNEVRRGADEQKQRNQQTGGRKVGQVRDTYLEKELGRQSKQRYKQLESKVIPSGRELENQRRLALAQTLLGMR